MASQNIWMQSLKWINHKNSLVEVLSNKSRDAFCDASILCDGKFYSVHKLVMSSCSDYLRGLFEQVTQCSSNTTHPVIILHDIQHQHLQYLLDLIYLGTVDVLQSDVPHLIKVAKCLQFKGLGVTNEFLHANTTDNDLEENNDKELDQCEVLSNEFLDDDCIDPLAFDSSAIAVRLTSPEEHLNTSLQFIQRQRTASSTDRVLPGGRKWKPGGRGRPPKNLIYKKGDPKNETHDNVLKVTTERKKYQHGEESPLTSRAEELQYTKSLSIECPICQQKFSEFEIESHASSCNFPTSSTSVVRSSTEASNKGNELPESKNPMKIRMKDQEGLKNKVANSIIRKKRRKKFLLTTQSIRKKYAKNYTARNVYLNKTSKFKEKIISNMENKSELIVNEIGDAENPKLNDGRLPMTNTVIPKVKRRGRPPKIKQIEINDNKEETCLKKVSHSSNLLDKNLHYSTTPRSVVCSNLLEKSNSNISGSTDLNLRNLRILEEGDSYSQVASTVENSNISPNSLFQGFDDFEWNEPPETSEILRSVKLEKDDKMDLESNLLPHEQFDDVTIKMEPTEDLMFTIESVRSIQNHSEESSDVNKYNDTGEDINFHGYDNLIENDIASNDEEYKPFGSRIKRCRRCFGCRLKENCGICVSCKSGKTNIKHIRCLKRQCRRLKRTKQNKEEVSESNINEKSPSDLRLVKTSDSATCSFCFKQFVGKYCKNVLYRHELAHKKKLQRYSCPSCDFSAYWLWEIAAHKKEIHKSLVTKEGNISHHQCDQCPYTSIRKDYMKKHMLKCHNVIPKDLKVAPLRPTMNESDKNKSNLKSSKRDSSKNKSTVFGKSKIGSSISCHYCEKQFSGTNCSSSLKQHLKIHEGQLEKCPHCSYTSVFIGNVYIHIKHKHKDILENHPEYKSISKILKAPAQLNRESAQNKKDAAPKRGPAPALSCATCGKMFRGPKKVRLLKLHNYYHKRTKLNCPHCSYHCYRKAFLDMHIKKIHPMPSGETEILQNFVSNQEMKLPLIRLQRLPEEVFNTEVQKEEQKPSQEISSKKNLSAMSSKDAWIESVDGKCPLCSRIYNSFSHFAGHWRSHTGEKPYTCPYCPYRSSHSSNRNWHVNKYH